MKRIINSVWKVIGILIVVSLCLFQIVTRDGWLAGVIMLVMFVAGALVCYALNVLLDKEVNRDN